jgi:hypothetical protein
MMSMSAPINLADPAFEPTDEQLAGLMSRAFAGVRPAHERAMARLRADIAVARDEALRALGGRGFKPDST